MNPVIFSIGSIEVRWYSFLILIGVLLAYILVNNEAKRFHYKKDFIFNLLFWTIIIGILGARIYYVIFNFDYYSNNLLEIIKIWHGGLAIHGGLFFGLVTVLLYCKKYHVQASKVLDMFVPALLLAQAIGRWGNFFNQEAFGNIVSYSQLVNLKIIPQFIIDNMLIDGAYRLPMFYFESIWCFVGFIISLIIRRKEYIKKGQIFGFYLMWYGFARFIIEIFRTDSLMLGSFKVAKIVSIIMFIVGFVIEIAQVQKPKLENLYNKTEGEINY